MSQTDVLPLETPTRRTVCSFANLKLGVLCTGELRGASNPRERVCERQDSHNTSVAPFTHVAQTAWCIDPAPNPFLAIEGGGNPHA